MVISLKKTYKQSIKGIKNELNINTSARIVSRKLKIIDDNNTVNIGPDLFFKNVIILISGNSNSINMD